MESTIKNELLTRNITELINPSELEDLLNSKKQLRIKYGIDPTSPKVHLGNATIILKLRDFQLAGHTIVLIIGDFTATIGDTSDKDSERPMLSKAEVKKNLSTYLQQIGKIIDLKKTEIHYNSTWLEKLSFNELSILTNHFTLSDFIARDNIARRLQEHKTVSLRELLYPIMQGYDSMKIKADIEIGGTEQRFNMIAGRKIQELYQQKPQQIMILNLLMGTDGRKMSKSWGNSINLTDTSKDVFGKVMRVSDEQIIPYYIACTRIPLEEVELISNNLKTNQANPRDEKLKLAEEITALIYDRETAQKEKEYFVSVFSEKEKPEDIPDLSMSGKTIVEILIASGIVVSSSEARRLIDQGSIKVDSEVITDNKLKVKSGSIVQKGKRFFVRVIE